MGQVITMPDNQCEDVALLLPWYVADTLDGDDHALVERHLVYCEKCSTKLEAERQLAAAVRADEGVISSGWQALNLQLDREEIEPNATDIPSPPRRAPRNQRGWRAPLRVLSTPSTLRWVVGGQFAALLVLGTITALPQQREGTYRALGDASMEGARQGNTLAMFRPDLSEALLRRALTRSGSRVVDGPTEAGAYVLDVPGGATGRQLATLRAQSGVTMAEPIGEETAE